MATSQYSWTDNNVPILSKQETRDLFKLMQTIHRTREEIKDVATSN